MEHCLQADRSGHYQSSMEFDILETIGSVQVRSNGQSGLDVCGPRVDDRTVHCVVLEISESIIQVDLPNVKGGR